MAKVNVWRGVKVALQSAIAAAVPITGMTNASPAVFTTTGTAPPTGSFVLVNDPGQPLIDGCVLRVTNLTTTTFSLDGYDSTLTDPYSSTGTPGVQVITYGTSITTASTVSASGGDSKNVNGTTIHDLNDSVLPAGTNPLIYSFDHFSDVSNAGQAALLAAARAGAQRAVKMVLLDGSIFCFNSYPTFSGAPVGSAGNPVTTPGSFLVQKTVTQYAS